MSSNMEYAKRIHDYLSGDLSAEEEKILFKEFSSKPELLEELNGQRAMEESLQKDLSTISIPSATTSTIFSSVGFAVPTRIQEVNTTTSSIAGIATSIYIVGIAVVALLGISIYLFVNTTKTEKGFGASNILHDTIIERVSTLENIPARVKKNINLSSSSVNTSVLNDSKENLSTLHSSVHTIANEPIKFYFDIGKFSSVDYLTQTKIIAVADGGKIYCSEDKGKSWVLQNSNIKNDLLGVHFFDTIHGIVVGANGAILTTSDAGRDWNMVKSNVASNLNTVRFATKDTIYACGASGTILRSSDSGMQWEKLNSGIAANLFKIRFTDGSNGAIIGEHGIMIETHDAGTSWTQIH